MLRSVARNGSNVRDIVCDSIDCLALSVHPSRCAVRLLIASHHPPPSRDLAHVLRLFGVKGERVSIDMSQ